MSALTTRAAFTCAVRRGESLQSAYRRASAADRAWRLHHRQIRMMCYSILGRLGHARWLAHEIETVKNIRDL